MWFLLSSDACIWMFSAVRFGDETRWWVEVCVSVAPEESSWSQKLCAMTKPQQ